MRTSEEIEGLEKLWDAKKSQFTIGELVRKQLIEIGEKYNLSDESFDFKAGSENPINFNSEEFETFINLIKFKKNNSSDLKYYSIQFEDGTFIGLAQQINEDFYLVSPADYLTLFDSLIQENEAGIKVEKILKHNYLEIVNAYKKLGYNSIIPNFNSFNFGSLNEKYIKGLKFEFLFSN